MSTTQLKLTIPTTLKALLKQRADRLGLPVSSYVKHLLIKDVEETNLLTYKASDSTLKLEKKAVKDAGSGRGVVISNSQELEDFINSL